MRESYLSGIYQSWSLLHALFHSCYRPSHDSCALDTVESFIMAMAGANADLTLRQAYCQDKFHLYRNGLPGAGDSLRVIYDGRRHNAAAAARWASINARYLTIPRPGNFQLNMLDRARLRETATASRTPFRGLVLQPFERPPGDIQEAIKDQLNNFRELLRASLRYVKCVGWGRDGVLTLWRYRPSRGQEYRVVMKQSAYGLGGRPVANVRPMLNTGSIMREKGIMTVSPNCNQVISLSSYLGMLTKSVSARCYVEHPILYNGSSWENTQLEVSRSPVAGDLGVWQTWRVGSTEPKENTSSWTTASSATWNPSS